MTIAAQPVIAIGTRGTPDQVETVHRGAVSVVSAAGVEIARFGNSGASYPLRSTGKPVQLLPYLSDVPDPGVADDELAVMMSSHNAESMHVERVRRLLDRHGFHEADLQCGAHEPIHEATRTRMLLAGEAPSAVHNNCSGKHAALLAVCKANGWDPSGYLEVSHPLQRRLRHLVSVLADHPQDGVSHSIDGCSLPTWWIPLHRLARIFARFALPSSSPPTGLPGLAEQLERLFLAGTGHPLLMSGTGRLDARLMARFPGTIFAKTGASGMYAVSVRPLPDYPDGLGIAVKVEDGDHDSTVRGVVLRETLRQLGVSPDGPDDWIDATIRNVRGTAVGETLPRFELERT